MRRSGNDSGFTMAEMIIVIGVMLSLFAVSYAAISAFLKEDALALQGQRLEVFFGKQRQRVRTTRIERRVVFDFVRRSMLVYTPGPDKIFGAPGNDAGEDDRLEEEVFLDKGLFFEKAVMTLDEFSGGSGDWQMRPFFEYDDPEKDMPAANEHDQFLTGALLFKKDGTIVIQKIRPGTGQLDESISSVNLDVSTSKWHTNSDADIIIANRGELKRLLIDVKPLAGKVAAKVARLGEEQ